MRTFAALSIAGLLLFGGAVTAADPAPSAADAAAVLEKNAPAIVSIKYVYKSQGKEWPYEARGTVVDAKGLVLVSNAYMSWGDAQVSGLKVLFGNDPKEWESVLVARDTVRGLAYVQVLSLGEKGVAALDLSKDAAVRVGDDLTSIWRDSRGFDYAPAISRHYVSARVEKPRPMWALGGDSPTVGTVFYDATGRPVGVSTYQEGGDAAEGDQRAARRVFLLPLPDVRASLDAAKKRVDEAVKMAEKAKVEPPAEEPAEKARDPAPGMEPDAPNGAK